MTQVSPETAEFVQMGPIAFLFCTVFGFGFRELDRTMLRGHGTAAAHRSLWGQIGLNAENKFHIIRDVTISGS